MTLASINLWTIIGAIQRNGQITPREIRQLLGCDSKKACRLMEHLVSVAAFKNVGQPRHPLFIMQVGGESRIKPIRKTKIQPCITEVCRLNWQGFKIHKIFGSGGYVIPNK